MKIKKWWLENYKSYGAGKTVIELNNGELILLKAPNGSGKSSLISSLDLSLYGEEHNKKGKRLAKSNFPNRINGNMKVGVEFETDKSITIDRSMENKNSSLKTNLVIDKIPYKRGTKIQETIEEKIGFDFKTYKSFISMDVNNFKNFISLTPEDKRILLDKLFNLAQINDLNKILKELKKNNDFEFKSIQNEINIYKDNIEDLKASIKEIKRKEEEKVNKEKVDNKSKIDEYKKSIKENKKLVTNLEEQKKDLKESIDIFSSGIDKLNTKLININRDITDTKEKINLYKLGKCPTCETELTGKLNLQDDFEEKLEKLEELKLNIKDKIKKANDELKNYNIDYEELNTSYQDLLTETKIFKKDIDKLKAEEEIEEDEDTPISEFEKNISKLEDKLENKNDKYLETQELKFVYDLLIPIWSDKGIKQDIINSIVDPINAYIEEDLDAIKTRFRIVLDSNFNAEISEFNNVIDPDSLSTGEEKKINLIIMLAYIKMLRNKQNINVLFLDEVFASIDIQGIDDILFLFKKFANERDINIFLVHHSELKEHMFDRVIDIEKNTFSIIHDYSL